MSEIQFVSYIDLEATGLAALADTLAERRAAVAGHAARSGGRLVAEFREIRLDGFAPARSELEKALALCQSRGAVLLVARLERLARDPAFLAILRRAVERMDLRFVAADMPEANEVTVGILAALAAVEAPRADSDRLARKRDFLAQLVAVQRPEAGPDSEQDAQDAGPASTGPGTGYRRPCMKRTLERAVGIAPVLAEIRAAGATTFEQVAHALNELGVPSARGDRWYPSQVRRVEMRIASAA